MVGYRWGGMEIDYIENRQFDKTNNIYSLWLARNCLDEDTILMECDIFFEDKLIKRLLTERIENRVVVDFFRPDMDGTVVEIGYNNEITKLITAEEQELNFDYSNKYKTVNVYLFTKEFLEEYFVPQLDLYIKTQSSNKYYELILSIFIKLHNPILRATVVNDVKWIEIDDFSDLKKANIIFASQDRKMKEISSVHGGYWRYDFKDFAYLYNLYFPPTTLMNEVRLNLDKLICNYPSCQKEIATSLANWVGVESEYLTVANGASEIIKILNTRLVKKIAIPTPTFNEYESCLKSEQIVYFNTDSNNFVLDIEDYVEVIYREQCNAALLINPNNPTGQLLSLENVRFFLEKLKDLDLVIVDESFIGFASFDQSQAIEREFKKYKNLVVVHSMGKELGILGIRLGYAISVDQQINDLLRKYLPIWITS